MKRYLAIAIILTGLFAAAVVRAEIIDRIVAIVNNDIITLSEYNENLLPFLDEAKAKLSAEEYKQQEQLIRNKVLDNMIDEKLLIQKANEGQIKVSSEEIDEKINDLKTENNIGSEEEFMKALEGEKLTLDSLRNQIESHLKIIKLRAKEVQFKVEVSEADARAYYEEHLDQYSVPPKVHVQAILIELARDEAEAAKAEKMSLAKAVVKRLRGGENIPEVLKEYAKNQNGWQGGDMGWMEKGKLLPEFDAVVFKIPLNEVSEPFTSSYGINIVKVLERQDAAVTPFDSIKDDVWEKLTKDKVDAKTRDWFDELRQKAFIDRRL